MSGRASSYAPTRLLTLGHCPHRKYLLTVLAFGEITLQLAGEIPVTLFWVKFPHLRVGVVLVTLEMSVL